MSLEFQDKTGEVVQRVGHILSRPLKEAIQFIFRLPKSTPEEPFKHKVIIIHDPLGTIGEHRGRFVVFPQKPKG